MQFTAYLGLATGEVIRGNNMGPGLGYSCTYSNLGQVDANGIFWLALDEFDPVNTAMVCTGNRVYKTTNLNAATPTWTNVLTVAAPATEMNMVRSSPVQQDLWMVIGYGATQIVVWWTTTGGAPWNTTNFTSGNADGAWQVFLELSAHDANRAWAMWVDVTNEFTYIGTTNDMWATAPSQTVIPKTCFEDNGVPRPCCHHRTYDNADDSERIYGGVDVKTGTDYARIYKSPDCATLYTDTDNAGWVWIHMVGCGAGTSNGWWAIASDDEVTGFWVSDDGIIWTEQWQWDIDPTGPMWWSRDCVNFGNNWQWYAMTRDGTSYPLRVSINRGESWYPQFGNWPAFVSDEGLGSPDVMCVAVNQVILSALTPVGAGIPDQTMDVDGNGDILYLGLYNSGGFPELLTVPLPLDGVTSTATSRYGPGAGDAINVKAHYLVGNFSIIAGHFGNNEQARRSEDGGPTYDDIDPGTWAANRAQPIAIDSNYEEHVLLALDALDDLVEKDSADAWADLNTALPFDVGAMAIFDLDPNEIVIGRINAGTPMVEYSPNNGSTLQDISGTLPITDGIASVELV